MKHIFVLFVLTSLAHARTLETLCKDNDCFQSGWTSQGSDGFGLTCECTQNDCKKYGWRSTDTDGSTYDVVCKAGGCFVEGWSSTQVLNGYTLYDQVTCNQNDCLKYGSRIKTSYDSGGKVTCFQENCQKYGGLMYWRGELWQTTCHNGDCYKYGWTSEIN